VAVLTGVVHRHDVGGGQGGRVVDPVADHADLAPLGPQVPDLACLVLRQHLGQHPADAGLAGDRGDRGMAI
jgi:hypothetical protein